MIKRLMVLVEANKQGGTMTWDSNYYATQNTFGNSVGIWIGWSILVLAMIIRVDMITHMVIIVLKVIYRGWV